VERACVALSGEGVSVKNWLPYLNRLSDYFFVLARHVSSKKGAKEILWDRS
jgi:cob(I)alamin adenosyltransferase